MDSRQRVLLPDLEEALVLFLVSCRLGREKSYDATGSFLTESDRRSIALFLSVSGLGVLSRNMG